MAISFTALISAGYTFGWQIVASLTAGSLAGLSMLLAILKDRRITSRQTLIENDDHKEGASYLVFLQRGRAMFPTFFILLLFFYSLMLATEMGVLRIFLKSLFRLPSPELIVIISMILLVCYAYVFVGGFKAVLITDYFQLIVVISFLGLLLAGVNFGALANLPSPVSTKIAWTPAKFTLLHFGVFCGAFSWTFANLDQWYRTVGTLPINVARKVLVQAVVLLCAFTVVPVIAGSLALSRHGIPSSVTNEISLMLVQDLLRTSNSTLRFVFVMALVCAALTTLNTYIMTIQQLYYELSIRIDAKTHRWYIVEYIVKWEQVRAVGLLFTIACFLASFFISDKLIYAFGVFALSGFAFIVPVLTAEALNRSRLRHLLLRVSLRATHGLVASLILFFPLMFFLRSHTGDISLHLYTIPAAASIAALIGNAPLLLFATRQEASNGGQ